MIPVTSAAATDVPDSKSYWPLGSNVMTLDPGAASVLLDPVPAVVLEGVSSLLATPITPSTFVGNVLASVVVEPTKITPRFRPFWTRADSSGSAGPAMLRLINGT